MTKIPFFQVDAFAPAPLTGNPAAVMPLEAWLDDAQMQAIAAENNLSETAFTVPADGREADYDLRWFTPTVEVSLCGHATLATAHVLYETGALAAGETARFKTKSGVLQARRNGEEIELNFPAIQSHKAVSSSSVFSKSLGEKAVFVSQTKTDYLVELGSERAVRQLRPDIAALKRVGGQGVIVTARSDGKPYDFVSRYFAPGAGIDEDPVTGAAHCALGPYWAAKLGKTTFEAYQASARGGHMRVTVEGERVLLAGRAVTMMRGELLH